ncbi:MAG: hypothetical protein IT364_25275 [Candidatus Hydrogenedentes bacterium]|nr:hypothetical protein [Candidatus Hydrogenedentota bacterium]
MKRYKWLIAIGVLAAFGLLMLSVNARIARSATNTNSQFSRGDSVNADSTKSVDLNRVFLHVENRVGLGSALAWELKDQLKETGKFTVVLLNNEPGPEDFPLLRVGITEKEGFWTPFYAKTRVKVLARYSSRTSEISLDTNMPFSFDGSKDEGKLPIEVRGEVEVDDSTTGLVTLTAYRGMLAKHVAEAIAGYLRRGIDDVEKKAAEKEDSP